MPMGILQNEEWAFSNAAAFQRTAVFMGILAETFSHGQMLQTIVKNKCVFGNCRSLERALSFPKHTFKQGGI